MEVVVMADVMADLLSLFLLLLLRIPVINELN